MEGFYYYRPYRNPELESLIELINPPRVCVDNDACKDTTLIKVDSANKHGILLELVQILTDLDLVISKSYICSDGGWFMDVFHVTDQFGNKVTDDALIQYIEKAICTMRNSKEAQECPGREVRPRHVVMEHVALEMTMQDQPGLLSEVSAVLADMGCHVSAAVAWTHNNRGACIIYVDDHEIRKPITDENRLSHIQEQLQNVINAHHKNGEKHSVRIFTAQTHTERRLHQLMLADEDYEPCSSCSSSNSNDGVEYETKHWMDCDCTQVIIKTCKENGYARVNIRCRDRPKLLFDTVCALTDMQYMIFHAAISSDASTAAQEYYVRHKNGSTLDSENERHKVRQCLIAAVERRGTQGLKLDITAKDRIGLLSDVTRVFREYGLSVTRVEIGTSGDKATGTFYVSDASGRNVSKEMVEAVEREIGGTVVVQGRNASQAYSKDSGIAEKAEQHSLGSLLWSRLERISGSFGRLVLEENTCK